MPAVQAQQKLALQRCVARAADAWPGLAVADGDDGIDLPLGLIALCWLRAFLPLVAADLPQTPSSRNGAGLGFVKDAFRHLAGTAPFELRVGTVVRGECGAALRQALRDAAATITAMPVRYIILADMKLAQPVDGAARLDWCAR